MKIAAIDFETANQASASVCSVGISTMEDGACEESYYTLIHPESNVSYFSKWNVRIHGIHPQDVKDAPTFDVIYPDLMQQLDGALVTAHNARFDMKCLKDTCLNTSKPIPVLSYFDTVELSRHVFPQLPHHGLGDMCDYLHIELNHHNALSDSYGCLMIVASVMNMTGIFDIEELLRVCHTRIYEL